MNARIEAPAMLIAPNDLELEENALGIALLGYPLPDWLEREDFWAGQHQHIFDAVRELGDRANLPSVASLLREQGYLAQYDTTPSFAVGRALHSCDLVRIMDGADFAMRMGWGVEFERLRELRLRRGLLDAMRRVEIQLRRDVIDAFEAGRLLREAMR